MRRFGNVVLGGAKALISNPLIGTIPILKIVILSVLYLMIGVSPSLNFYLRAMTGTPDAALNSVRLFGIMAQGSGIGLGLLLLTFDFSFSRFCDAAFLGTLADAVTDRGLDARRALSYGLGYWPKLFVLSILLVVATVPSWLAYFAPLNEWGVPACLASLLFSVLSLSPFLVLLYMPYLICRDIGFVESAARNFRHIRENLGLTLGLFLTWFVGHGLIQSLVLSFLGEDLLYLSVGFRMVLLSTSIFIVFAFDAVLVASIAYAVESS
jgi:hypothetical protein